LNRLVDHQMKVDQMLQTTKNKTLQNSSSTRGLCIVNCVVVVVILIETCNIRERRHQIRKRRRNCIIIAILSVFMIMGQQDKRQAFSVNYLIPTTTTTTTVLHLKHTAASTISHGSVSSSPTPTTTAKSSYQSSYKKHISIPP